MKSLSFAIFALVLSTASASADWGRPGPGPGPGPGWGGSCQVTFKKCDFAINGFCVKWNRKAMTVPRHQARWGCEIAQRQYGQIRDCNIQCR